MRNIYFIICFFILATTQAQTTQDFMYFWKSGVLIEKRSIKTTDLDSITFKRPDNFYTNYTDLQVGLTSCYEGMQAPLSEEWSLTELRSDNTVSDTGSSTSAVNQDFSYLDQFYPSTSHQGNYNYWLKTYNNIRNTNIVMNAAGANYNETSGSIEFAPVTIPVSIAQCQSIAAEASFIRAYHYFNLVRLYGGVFLIHEVLPPAEAKTVNRSSVDDIYKLIIADLNNAITNGNKATYATLITSQQDQIDHANKWAAQALLAKVYLTLGRKAEAAFLLQSVISSSGYGLETSYANVFSTFYEMNKEILFAVRFKSGGVGMGNPLANLFAPSNSGNAIVNGVGKGYNTPTSELLNLFCSSATVTDLRRSVTIGEYAKFPGITSVAANNTKTLTLVSLDGIKVGQLISGLGITTYNNIVKTIDILNKTITISSNVTVAANTTLCFYTSVYPNKYISFTALAFDAENDVPIIRYSDVLLMLAEAEGRTGSESLLNINKVRTRAGLAAYTSFASDDDFEKKLSQERKLEFAFENQRWFDLLRFNATFQNPANKAEGVMDAHFTALWSTVYSKFSVLPITLAELLENSNLNRFLLPIPQYEIDTNSLITQNPGY